MITYRTNKKNVRPEKNMPVAFILIATITKTFLYTT